MSRGADADMDHVNPQHRKHIRNLIFFKAKFNAIATNLNDFHSVQQSSWYFAGVVRGSNEQHRREVKGHIQVVVNKRVVLLRIQYF